MNQYSPVSVCSVFFYDRFGVQEQKEAHSLEHTHFIILAQDSSSFPPPLVNVRSCIIPGNFPNRSCNIFFFFDKCHIDKPLSISGSLSEIFMWNIYSEM